MKPLKTLDEHNAARRLAHDDWWQHMNEPRKNGIACPQCGGEMVDTNPSITLTSNPPQKNVSCPACSYTGYRIA